VASSRRRSTSALVPFAALALLAGGFLAVRPDRVPDAPGAPTGTQTSAPPAHPSPPSNALTRPPNALVRSEDAAARIAARRFLADYLRLVRGRGSVRALRHTASALRRELRRHPARATPALQLRPSTIRGVDLTPQGAGSVRAIAILQEAGGPPYPLLLYLERRGSGWLVTRIGDA
jgi:hypothetical protein